MANKSYKKELGFFTLVSIVISSQLGSGTFIFPSLLAPHGTIGLLGWIPAVLGAISLALIFSDLASQMPKNGGPHVYVTEAFGKTAGFFTAWTYWIISWASSSVLLVTILKYLPVFTGELSTFQIISIETLVLFAITFLNIGGVKFSGSAEAVLTVFKIVPLLILPLLFFSFFDASNFSFKLNDTGFSGSVDTITKAALLMFWGFVGVESATTPAERVNDAKRTIPRAIIIGTSCVSFIYVMNVISVIGVTGFDSLLNAKAPYVLAISSSIGASGNVFMSALAIIVCVGTLNAWTLTGGQIAVGAAEDKFFPPLLGRCNKGGAPVVSLLLAALGMVPFFIFEQMYGSSGLDNLLDIVVSIFLFVYIACSIAYIKVSKAKKVKVYSLSIFAVGFCLFVALPGITKSLTTLAIIIILGIPVHLYTKRLRNSCKTN